MNTRLTLASVLLATALSGVADAQTGSGTLGVTANVQGSINLTFVTDASGIALTGSTTNAASMALGTVSMNSGTTPANVTKTLNGVVSFTLSTPFDVRADLSNSASTTYTLSVTLSAADANHVWVIGPTDISSGAAFALTSTGAYATAVPFVLSLTIPATAQGSISNTLNFTATAN
jgi:hypothetical protein